MPSAPIPRPHTAVATVLTPMERAQVDAAGEGLYHTVHRESLKAVLQDRIANDHHPILPFEKQSPPRV